MIATLRVRDIPYSAVVSDHPHSRGHVGQVWEAWRGKTIQVDTATYRKVLSCGHGGWLIYGESLKEVCAMYAEFGLAAVEIAICELQVEAD